MITVRKGNARNRGPCMGCLKKRGRVWRVRAEVKHGAAWLTEEVLRLCASCARELAQELPR